LVLRWLCGLIGYPAQSLGTLTSGGSIATLVSVVAARDAQGINAVLVRNPATLQRSHGLRGVYLQDATDTLDEPSPADLSPELTRHFRGMRMWLPLQVHGLARYRAALEEKLLLCNFFYRSVQELGFEVGPEPDLSVALFRWVP